MLQYPIIFIRLYSEPEISFSYSSSVTLNLIALIFGTKSILKEFLSNSLILLFEIIKSLNKIRGSSQPLPQRYFSFPISKI